MGSLLFLLFVIDVFEVTRNGTPFIFADDITIVCIVCPEVIESTINNISQDLTSRISWVNDGIMKFFAKKQHHSVQMRYISKRIKAWKPNHSS